MTEFGAHSTTDEVLAGIDLTGKVAAVTGGSGGLGLETSRALAAHGAHVVLAARDSAKLEAAVSMIRDEHSDASLSTIVLDLANIESCRSAAGQLLDSHDRLDLLINNAGVMCTPFGRTADGFETQLGVNHLGHMAWTMPLIELLTESSQDDAPSRVINLSSAGHRFGGFDLDDLNFETREYGPWEGYGQSKTANVLFSVELERRFGAAGVRSVAVHPGGIHTDLGRYMTAEIRSEMGERIKQSNPGGVEWKSIPQGAATTVWAATTPDLASTGGVYCEDCSVAEIIDEPDSPVGVRSYAVDPQKASALWELSEQMLAAV